MGLEPYENEFDGDEDIVCYRDYDFLNKYEKELVGSRLREDFSRYISVYRRLISKEKWQHLIEKGFKSCPEGLTQYSRDFSSTYQILYWKRENTFICEGVLPKRFTPTEIKKLLEQSVMLESERLIFRKITNDDYNDLAVMLRDPKVMTAWGHTFSDEQIQTWIDNQLSRYR